MIIGDIVVINEGHPFVGKKGIYIEDEVTIAGRLYLIQLDDGIQVAVKRCNITILEKNKPEKG